MIPQGFLEDPFVYPTISCHGCRSSFTIAEPFYEYTFFECPKCHKQDDIPLKVIWDLMENMEFLEYLRQRPRSPQPPIYPQDPQGA